MRDRCRRTPYKTDISQGNMPRFSKLTEHKEGYHAEKPHTKPMPNPKPHVKHIPSFPDFLLAMNNDFVETKYE